MFQSLPKGQFVHHGLELEEKLALRTLLRVDPDYISVPRPFQFATIETMPKYIYTFIPRTLTSR